MPQIYEEHETRLPVRRFIEKVWTYVPDRNGLHLVLPDGRMDVILRFRINPSGKCVDAYPILAGPTDRPGKVPVVVGDGFVGVRLLPGGAGGFGRAAHLLSGQVLRGDTAIEAVPALRNLRGQGKSLPALIDLLEAWTTESATQPPDTIGAAMDALHLTGGREKISAIADMIGISTRKLHRLFRNWVGFSPKTYAEILRFHRALRLLSAGVSPAAVAMEAGYADQSHMTRDFQRFGEFSPYRRPNVVLAGLPIQ